MGFFTKGWDSGIQLSALENGEPLESCQFSAPVRINLYYGSSRSEGLTLPAFLLDPQGGQLVVLEDAGGSGWRRGINRCVSTPAVIPS
jgi:hypothetical protein